MRRCFPFRRSFSSLITQTHHPHHILRNSASVASLLQRFIDSDSPSNGRTIHAHILESGFRPSTSVSIKLLILHIKAAACTMHARCSIKCRARPSRLITI
uniref:Uncharacterized protein n=1 Tax=Ananas comosus var. bracteatus TaxID=296719 RepID=A0A6V7NL27_ANACO|nr:unnamed protein product [Ananas comosus var. bracteatus]